MSEVLFKLSTDLSLFKRYNNYVVKEEIMDKNLVFYMNALRSSFMQYYKEKMDEIGLSKGLHYFIIAIGSTTKCSPNEVAQKTKMDAGHTTRYVNKLVDAGYVIKEPNPNDGRSCYLKLTEKGLNAYTQSKNIFKDWTDNMMSNLTPTESEQLMSLLSKLFNGKENQFIEQIDLTAYENQTPKSKE